MIRGWQCSVCAAVVDIGGPLIFRCPNSTPTDPFHALEMVIEGPAEPSSDQANNPFLRYQQRYAWNAFGAAHGMSEQARHQLVLDTDAKVASVAGTGFHVTPFQRAAALSAALGFAPAGGIWVKDETRQVGGSHKARHLYSTLLALLVAEVCGLRPSARAALAIASCGNAALAAATLAAAERWPIQVFVPPQANPAVMARLAELGATINVCPRRRDDPPGDPCVLRYREAVAAGAIPFSVQGPENVWCLDGARSIGWEMAPAHLQRVFIQVGAGAFAHSVIDGLAEVGQSPRLHAVQTGGCAPLRRAYERAIQGPGGLAGSAKRWAECMTPWADEPFSAADGILDDETYDWLAVSRGIAATEGSAVVAEEADVLRAYELVHRLTDVDASHTGTAGLAGLLAIRDEIGENERVGIVLSGIRR